MAIAAHTVFIHTMVVIPLLTLGPAANATAQNPYTLDDGTADTFIGVGEPPFGLAALNHFIAQPQAETIVSVSIAWGQVPDNSPATILLYKDPDGDGDPNDAQLIDGALVATANGGSNTFSTYNFSAPFTFAPGESFFVGFWLQMPAGNWHPASFDHTDPMGESWAVISFQNFWIADLDLNALPPTRVENIAGLGAGNWMIRAHGVPGPGGLIVMAAGVLASRARRRR